MPVDIRFSEVEADLRINTGLLNKLVHQFEMRHDGTKGIFSDEHGDSFDCVVISDAFMKSIEYKKQNRVGFLQHVKIGFGTSKQEDKLMRVGHSQQVYYN